MFAEFDKCLDLVMVLPWLYWSLMLQNIVWCFETCCEARAFDFLKRVLIQLSSFCLDLWSWQYRCGENHVSCWRDKCSWQVVLYWLFTSLLIILLCKEFRTVRQRSAKILQCRGTWTWWSLFVWFRILGFGIFECVLSFCVVWRSEIYYFL